MNFCFYSPIVESVFALVNAGQSVLVAGRGGTGKTTLLRAVRERLESSGISIVELDGCSEEQTLIDHTRPGSSLCVVGDHLPLREVLRVSVPTVMVAAVRDVNGLWDHWDHPLFGAVRQKFGAAVVLDQVGFPPRQVALLTLW